MDLIRLGEFANRRNRLRSAELAERPHCRNPDMRVCRTQQPYEIGYCLCGSKIRQRARRDLARLRIAESSSNVLGVVVPSMKDPRS